MVLTGLESQVTLPARVLSPATAPSVHIPFHRCHRLLSTMVTTPSCSRCPCCCSWALPRAGIWNWHQSSLLSRLCGFPRRLPVHSCRTCSHSTQPRARGFSKGLSASLLGQHRHPTSEWSGATGCLLPARKLESNVQGLGHRVLEHCRGRKTEWTETPPTLPAAWPGKSLTASTPCLQMGAGRVLAGPPWRTKDLGPVSSRLERGLVLLPGSRVLCTRQLLKS